MNTPKARYWYQEKWVWLIIAIPAMSVVLGIVMITLAVGGRDSLVKDDYYKEGRMINIELRKDQLAEELGLSASILLDGTSVFISLQGNAGFESPAMVNLQVIHPTLDNADHNFMLIKNDQQYTGQLPEVTEGRRYIQLTDQDSTWRLKGEAWLPNQNPVLLEPAIPGKSSTLTPPPISDVAMATGMVAETPAQAKY